MCGRYRLSRRKQLIEEYFAHVSGQDDWNPRYNIARTQPIPIIRQNPKEPIRDLSLVRCGLIPSWGKEPIVVCMRSDARTARAVFTHVVFVVTK